MVWRILLILMVTLAITAMPGCKKKEPASPLDKAMNQVEEAADDAADIAEDVDVEAELDKMEAEIDAEE
ncbi:MAG: hypothetical protein H8E62_02890 [Planctomycetes bacterium]|nr:hypothetical protein [Planctomycetota bacterium]